MLELESLPPALNPDQIRKRQESFKALQQAVAEHKPLLDKLVKAGGALLKLVGNDEGRKLAEIIDADVDRFENIKVRRVRCPGRDAFSPARRVNSLRDRKVRMISVASRAGLLSGTFLRTLVEKFS